MKLNDVDLNKIRIFCQVVDSGNYRLASEVLNVTPSALSQSIAVLEHSLAFPLFHRTGKKLIPTENGLALHREFKIYHRQFVDSIQKISSEKDQIQGMLRIGAYLEFAKSQLAPVISEFLKDHPQVQVKMNFETPSRLQNLLEKGKIDLCFSIFPSVQTRIVESQPVYKEELVLIAPKSYLSKELSYSEILKMPLIEYYLNHQPLRRWLFLHYKKRPQHLPIRIFASTAEMVLALVKQDAGIGVVPKFILDEKALSTVQILRPTERKFSEYIWMLEKKMSSKRAVHEAFADAVTAYFKRKLK